MRVTFTNRFGSPEYRIRTHSNGLCYELLKWQPGGKVVPARKGYPASQSKPGWQPLGRYPSNLDHAFTSVAEIILKDSQENFAAGTVEELHGIVEDIQNLLQSYKAEVEA